MTPARQLLFWLVGLSLTVLLLYALRAVLLPFVAGMAIAYLCDPVVDRLVRWRFPRALATLTVIGGAILVFVAALLLAAPLLQAQTISFIERLPAYVEDLRRGSEALLGALQDRISPAQMEQLRDLVSGQIASVAGQLGSIVGAVFSLRGVLSWPRGRRWRSGIRSAYRGDPRSCLRVSVVCLARLCQPHPRV